jgi:hypothetical protein
VFRVSQLARISICGKKTDFNLQRPGRVGSFVPVYIRVARWFIFEPKIPI